MTKKTKNTNNAKRAELPRRDITSFVTRGMLYGNLPSLGIPRNDLESALERYCRENPSVDATAMPLVGLSDSRGKDALAAKAIALAKRHCGQRGSRTAVFSKDGHSAIIFGRSAREIVSKAAPKKGSKLVRLKTKMKVECTFPYNRKLNCFGGEKVADCTAK